MTTVFKPIITAIVGVLLFIFGLSLTWRFWPTPMFTDPAFRQGLLNAGRVFVFLLGVAAALGGIGLAVTGSRRTRHNLRRIDSLCGDGPGHRSPASPGSPGSPYDPDDEEEMSWRGQRAYG